MKKPLLVGLAGLALLGIDSAKAADIAVQPYPTATPVIVPPPYFEWFGPYVGAIGGGGFQNTRTEYSYSSTQRPLIPFQGGFETEFGPGGPLNVTGESAVASAITQGFLPTSLGKKASGFFTAGGLIGFNFQMAQLVYGIEGDLSWMNGVRRTSFVAPPLTGTTGTTVRTVSNNVTQSAGLRWFATVRGRVGYAINRLLIYGTGGFAFARATVTSTESLTETTTTTPPSTTTTTTDLFTGTGGRNQGFVVGGGIEYALFDYLTIRAEGLYYNLGTVHLPLGPAANPTGLGQGLAINTRQTFQGEIFRIGLSYKPDWL